MTIESIWTTALELNMGFFRRSAIVRSPVGGRYIAVIDQSGTYYAHLTARNYKLEKNYKPPVQSTIMERNPPLQNQAGLLYAHG